MIWAFADAWGLGLACLDGLALGWLRFVAIWQGRRFVWLCLALPSGCDLASLFALRSSAFVPVVSCLRCDLLCLGFVMVCFASAYVWRFGSSNAWRFTI